MTKEKRIKLQCRFQPWLIKAITDDMEATNRNSASNVVESILIDHYKSKK